MNNQHTETERRTFKKLFQDANLLFPICILKYFSIRVEASREDKPASGQLRGDAEEYSKHVCQKGKPHQSLLST